VQPHEVTGGKDGFSSPVKAAGPARWHRFCRVAAIFWCLSPHPTDNTVSSIPLQIFSSSLLYCRGKIMHASLPCFAYFIREKLSLMSKYSRKVSAS
jgi:hypothetical protein